MKRLFDSRDPSNTHSLQNREDEQIRFAEAIVFHAIVSPSKVTCISILLTTQPALTNLNWLNNSVATQCQAIAAEEDTKDLSREVFERANTTASDITVMGASSSRQRHPLMDIK